MRLKGLSGKSVGKSVQSMERKSLTANDIPYLLLVPRVHREKLSLDEALKFRDNQI